MLGLGDDTPRTTPAVSCAVAKLAELADGLAGFVVDLLESVEAA